MSELNTTAAALLSLLHDGPQTGAQLCTSATRYGSFFSITRSQVYRELPSLAFAGFVRLGKQGPRASQEYIVTAAGKKRFKAWLSEPFGPDHLRSPLIMRLIHAGTLAADQRRALLGTARRVYLAEHDAAKAGTQTAADPTKRRSPSSRWRVRRPFSSCSTQFLPDRFR